MMNEDTLKSSEEHVFYHAASFEAAENIAREGFKVWLRDEDMERYCSGGNLGAGIYITCNWRIALWFGPLLLRVAIRPRTKLLNSALRPDPKVLQYLQREFGREILTQSPWRVIPKNKRLKLQELITLFRYHYWRTWEKDYAADKETFARWPGRREMHLALLADFKNILVRYGFDGYGNPEDDNGIVVFSGDRVTLAEVVGELPDREHQDLLASDFRQLKDIEQLRSLLKSRGSERAKKLAEQARGPLSS